MIAVKPKDIPTVLAEITPVVTADQTVVSIAAGVPLAVFEESLENIPVVRAMPNTPSAVDLGMTAYTCGFHVDDDHHARAKLVLGSVGETLELSDEVDAKMPYPKTATSKPAPGARVARPKR